MARVFKSFLEHFEFDCRHDHRMLFHNHAKKKKKPFLSCKSLVVIVAIPLDQFHICKDISSMCKTVPFELVLSIKAGPGHSLSAYDLSKFNLSACFIGVFSILAAFSQYAQLSSFPMVLGP